MSSAGANFTLTAKVPAACIISGSHIISNGGAWEIFVNGIKAFDINGAHKVPLPPGKVEIRQKI